MTLTLNIDDQIAKLVYLIDNSNMTDFYVRSISEIFPTIFASVKIWGTPST